MDAEAVSPLQVALELHRAYATATMQLNKALQPLGLGYRHVAAMFLIRDGVRTHRDLAHALQADKAGMFRTLADMERQNLVTKTRSEHDRRSQLLHLTDHGHAKLFEAQHHTRAVAQNLFGTLSHDELATVHAALARVPVS
ncbi:MarR family winged helix-turn-helix transcriptional regulator [Microbacterium hydrocarbonoxydans]|uniref:MarR family winged helix-turn-helix transcriptional regulator n=1 Tax=Microbacterium hydrocarbonoxydans TaxID=273678 RepID=UPI003D96C24C